MARKDQDEAPETKDPSGTPTPEEDADGYRPTRRQLARKGEEAQAETAKDKPKDDKAPGKVDGFMEEHWESWLRPVLLLVVLTAGVLGYRWDLIPESIAGLIAAGGVVLVTIYATAWPAWDLIEENRHRILFGVLVAVWALSAGVPVLRKAVPRPVLGETVLTKEKKTAIIKPSGGATGPFDLTVSGKIQPSGAQQANASYEITVTAGSVSELVTGELEYSVHQTRSRRGASHWTEKHDRNVHRLPAALRGSEVTLSTEDVDDLLQDGLHILLHPRDPVLPLLMPRIGGEEVPVLLILVVLVMIFVETRIGDAQNKPYLVMAAATTLVFSWRFTERATATNLVPPAVEALFMALVIGGVGGTFLGWLARRFSGRAKLKPAKSEKDKDRRRDED